ncbi:MAG: 4Fe-4S binding protein [Candidatus Omnitrophota bacterium]
MPKIKIDKELCKGCALCVASCPNGLIVICDKVNSMGLKVAQFKGEGKCTGCAFCAVMCPDCAIEVYK